MRPQPSNHLRIARPAHDLARAERFWVDGLGLSVQWRSDPAHWPDLDLVMVGWPDASWHLELVHEHEAGVLPVPTEEDLLVLYLDGPIDPATTDRLVAAGGTRVPARNPYWEEWGVTIEDPDGYRLVLCSRQWPDV
jgi:catechol 2,3-dioxygenase-like lactoylglutathione lyase family enzyme